MRRLGGRAARVTMRLRGRAGSVAAPIAWRCAGFPAPTSGSAAAQSCDPRSAFWGRSHVGAVADRGHHCKGQHDKRHVAVPAVPGAGLVVVEAEFGLEVLILLLDGPAVMRQADDLDQRRRRGQIDEIVFGARRGADDRLNAGAAFHEAEGPLDADARVDRIPLPGTAAVLPPPVVVSMAVAVPWPVLGNVLRSRDGGRSWCRRMIRRRCLPALACSR